MAPRRMLKRKETEEEKLFKQPPFLLEMGFFSNDSKTKHGWRPWLRPDKEGCILIGSQ
ncbi:unnamed protein product [Prunus brigantina]